jgi:hypothetical protein
MGFDNRLADSKSQSDTSGIRWVNTVKLVKDALFFARG